jgi:adenylate cyclase
MNRFGAVGSVIRGGLVELVRPGEGGLSNRAISAYGRVLVTIVIAVTNVIGAGAVLVIALFVIPMPTIKHIGHVELVNALATIGYAAFALVLGTLLGTRGLTGIRNWLREERPATVEEMRLVLHAPLRLLVLQVALWLGGAVVFGAIDFSYDATLGIRVVIVVAITGLVTASCAYLLTERLLRTAAARALADGVPDGIRVPGVTTRALLAWALGTGLPTLGVVAIGILALAGDHASTRTKLGVTMVVLGAIGIIVGLLAVTVAARATADPVDSVRRALAKVQTGDLEVRVPVYDGSQVGQLQLGFNRMVEGLAERERIREAFGTYVDPDVAEHILSEGTDLAGEEVEVTIMFIDVRDFTAFAERTPAPRVVAGINRLFELVVPIIHAHGGRVDKFVGDGLMAVFGAPNRQPDHADQALAAALEIEGAVNAAEQQLKIGIGLNSGTVVAGNIGGAGRLEFGVIGDAVNVAARVEAATRETGDTVLVTERTKELLAQQPQPPLVERHGVALKGKSETVRLFAPAEGSGEAAIPRAQEPPREAEDAPAEQPQAPAPPA